MINMIKELTRPLLILVFTQCVMVKGSKGIQAWQYPLLITLQLHRAGTASYNLRKSYFGFKTGNHGRFGTLFEFFSKI